MDLGIAVWDVIGRCERQGSLDQAIRKPVPNDLVSFLGWQETIGRIILNGTRAAAEFRRLGDQPVFRRCRVIVVPSSSPVPSRQYRYLEDKINAWRAALRD
jgi:TDG/mug DNA glycosylase family protein